MSATERLKSLEARIGPGWFRFSLGAAIIVGSLLIATLITATGPSAEPQARSERAWPVSVVSAEPASRSPTLIAYGKVESRQTANLKTSISAPVAQVLTPEGTWVEEGELMIRMDDRELVLALRRAESEHKRRVAALTAVRNDFRSAQNMTPHHRELKDITSAKLKRHEELYAKKMIPDSILDEVRQQASERAISLEQHLLQIANFPSLIDQHEASVAESKAILDQATLDVAQAEIRAPFAGRVIRTMVSPGDRILPGVALIQVADYDRLEVRTSVPPRIGDQLRRRLQQGDEIQATGKLAGHEIELHLDRLSGDVKTGQSGLDAFFVPSGDVNLDIGRVVDLTITLPPEEKVVAVPIQSIYENERVYKVEDDRLVAIPIEHVGDHVDASGNYSVLVRSPAIKQGDRLITTQLPRAITGLLVEPIDASGFEEALAGGTRDDGDSG